MTKQKLLPHASYHDVYTSLREYFRTHPEFGNDVWRADSLARTKTLPLTLRRAHALNAILENSSLVHTPGALLVGAGYAGWRVSAGTFTPECLQAGQNAVVAIGDRTFRTHANHHSLDYETILKYGLAGLEQRAQPDQAADGADLEFLQSVVVALQGLRQHVRRWSEHLTEKAQEKSPFSPLLLAQADQLTRLADEPPQTFRDALQLVFLCHCAMQLDNRYAQAFGRLDQYLYPFYQADLAEDRVTPEEAQNLFDHLFAAITAPDDFTGDVQNITLGGVKPADGSDAVNDLSYMILEACKRVGKPGGNCTARISSHTPRAFVEKCSEVIHTGVGYPAVFNDDLEVAALEALGYPPEHARDYVFVGCIEVQIQGRHAPWADDRLNPLHSLNLALFNGVDSLTGTCVEPFDADPPDFEAFYQRFLHHARTDIQHALDDADASQKICDARPQDYTTPLMSAFTADCITRGRDMNDGGAVYPGDMGYGCMGIGSLADSLMAVKKLVYDRPTFTLEKLRQMCLANFDGFENERQVLLRGVPKFGNAIEEVDTLAARIVRDLAAVFAARRTPQGGRYLMLMAANTSNIWAGNQIGATPDGRFSGQPVSDASSPTFGRDQNGPTAVIRSIARLPYELCPAGNVVNIKLSPLGNSDERWCHALTSLIISAMQMGVSELQFNTTGAETLKKAMAEPEAYENLVVRVSGFSANFVRQGRAVQEDILARTEHQVA